MNTLIQQIINSPLASLLIIGNLILIESLLSVDNAAVLATMVLALPRRERAKALKYGIFGAYISRGICLFIASYLVKIWWLKAVGGLYLIYLCANWLTTKLKQRGNEPDKKPVENRLYKFMSGRISSLWAAVISVELMDLAFSMDNVFAAGYDSAGQAVPAPLSSIAKGDHLSLCGQLYSGGSLGIHWVHTNCGATPTSAKPNGWVKKVGDKANMEDNTKYCGLWN